MADLTSSDIGASSGTDYAKTADSLLGTQKSGMTWQDVIKLAQTVKMPSGGPGALPGVASFNGYKQNVPVAQIQPIPDTDEKKSDQGMGEAVSWLAKIYGGGDFGGASSSTGGGGAF